MKKSKKKYFSKIYEAIKYLYDIFVGLDMHHKNERYLCHQISLCLKIYKEKRFFFFSEYNLSFKNEF